MKKITLLNLYKFNPEQRYFKAIPDLIGKRYDESIDFLKHNRLYALVNYNNMPLLSVLNEKSDKWEKFIGFYKRVNNQFFGKSYITGKCIYGLSSHPWHKKVKKSEFTLFESKVNFDDLYHYDYHNGKYIPEFSNKKNWIQAYHLEQPDNLKRALDYAMSQSAASGLFKIS